MTDYAEEQSMEIEAMQAVFMDDFELISSDPSTYKIKIVPVLGGENYVGVSMVVKYTPKYPDEIPNICFVDAINISDDDIINLTQMIYDKIPEFLGMAMVYNITEVVKDWLLDRNVPKQEEGSMYDEMIRRQQKAKELADAEAEKEAAAIAEKNTIEHPKNWGTPVTPESFAAWKAKFESEMEKKEVKTVEKLTGKELFEKNGKTILENEDEILDKADHETGEDDDHVLVKEEEGIAEEEEEEEPTAE
ncbi:rwd domain containing protein [Blastocystis sp. ATCC 50177/Nand II]|uniref:Rwd domain containing protein n=1 Tax=Blastocystis sp. subtype 1 (strain ATCC 50177 / NandII) TaxID=478820 RepID=A0A196S417_BLAHN|nr:rwd domain containing protein [Blastocystis sp. ATCC 50177/Nand II]